MGGPFDYFVILAEMRTGSNYLEVNLKNYPGLNCYGEAFNPNIMGEDRQTEMLGMSLQEREADPLALISRMKENQTGCRGFASFMTMNPGSVPLSGGSRLRQDCFDQKPRGHLHFARNRPAN